jgi:hypothetical protein
MVSTDADECWRLALVNPSATLFNQFRPFDGTSGIPIARQLLGFVIGMTAMLAFVGGMSSHLAR